VYRSSGRRPEREHHGLGRAHHPQADRRRRVDAGREEPDPEPAKALQVLRSRLLAGRAGAPAGRSSPASARARSAAGGGRRRSAPTTSRRTACPTTGSASPPTTSTRCSPASSTPVVDALLQDERARQLEGDEPA
jgi:hypothetical protein